MDCFMNRKTGELIIIEANTLPALTPSTTFFQQAASLPKPLNPRQLLEKIIEIGKKRFQK
jgi:D-alanine-D-alanine ligase-like ATP-grasp enzyme